MPTYHSMCPMNCHPTFCGMTVEVEDGKPVSIAGDGDNPDSRGFLCVRGRAASEILGNDRRLLHPLVRANRKSDDWRQAGWDEVLDIVAAKIGAVEPREVAFWTGHGLAVNDYGVGLKWQLIERLANLYGCQRWNPAMTCWGLGGFGLGLTGALETSTKEDMGANSNLILLWGANLPSQPNTARFLLAAKRRGAKILAIDVRETEATAQADETYLISPGCDATLALALMNAIVAEGLVDRNFIAGHTVGFEALAGHVRGYTPEWAEAKTGIAAARIRALARDYATVAPAMVVIGGSSLHKGANGWMAARAISCLPALIGAFGKPGGGIGPRHGSVSTGRALNSIAARDRRKPGDYVPDQMPAVSAAIRDGTVKVLLVLGSNMLSSFPDNRALARGLDSLDLTVGYDLFMTDTFRDHADIVLPATAWLEEVGAKATNTHLYLCDKAVEPAGEARPLDRLLRDLADRLGVEDYFPWTDSEAALDAVIGHKATGHASVAGMRANGGRAALEISHVAYPDGGFSAPSGKIEFYSDRAAALGLPPLPMPTHAEGDYPLTLCQGRTIAHFHSFYDQSQALPSLARLNKEPEIWISPDDAAARGIENAQPVRVHNSRGEFDALARVTEKIRPGAVWMRDGWTVLNRLTSNRPAVPDNALDLFHFTVGQADYETYVDVAPGA